ncbi:hypothetical protein PIB30_069135 [Stylosanthes scabra]|uniref:Phytocyanin domain-containing protein n=1 Tax=Stylosanthes scabra TaxID=79078 RepID=A0ABU6TMS4_9FABA|nr:hypothetical protein [Stylosanthes scabra]
MAPSRTLIIILVALSTISSTIAEEYIVGDYYGWRTFFDYQAWAANKNFYVGDRIVFNYRHGWDNVVSVTPEDFITCTASPNAKTSKSGHDEIRFGSIGARWYISSVSDHCKLGQKLAIYVRPARFGPPLPSEPPSPAPEPFTPITPSIATPPAPAPAPWTPITPSAEPSYSYPPQVGPTPTASAPRSPITPSASLSPITPSAEPHYHYVPTVPPVMSSESPAPSPYSESHSASWTTSFSGRFARSMPKKPFRIFH